LNASKGGPGVSAALLGVIATLAAGCSHKGTGNKQAGGTPMPAVVAAAPVGTPGHFACFGGLRSYRYTGHSSLDLPPGAAPGRLGSFANLLKDVTFEGAAAKPDASTLSVHFGNGASQDLQTVHVKGKDYQRAGQGAWQQSSRGTPFIAALSRFEPQSLCEQTLAQVEIGSKVPTRETINGTTALHYTFEPADLASSGGVLGEGSSGQGAAEQGQPNDLHLEVWVSEQSRYPVRIMAKNTLNGAGNFAVQIDIIDFNGADVSIKAPL